MWLEVPVGAQVSQEGWAASKNSMVELRTWRASSLSKAVMGGGLVRGWTERYLIQLEIGQFFLLGIFQCDVF